MWVIQNNAFISPEFPEKEIKKKKNKSKKTYLGNCRYVKRQFSLTHNCSWLGCPSHLGPAASHTHSLSSRGHIPGTAGSGVTSATGGGRGRGWWPVSTVDRGRARARGRPRAAWTRLFLGAPVYWLPSPCTRTLRAFSSFAQLLASQVPKFSGIYSNYRTALGDFFGLPFWSKWAEAPQMRGCCDILCEGGNGRHSPPRTMILGPWGEGQMFN